jgi:DNA-directed RNA polymerase specialized sigma24 family protein
MTLEDIARRALDGDRNAVEQLVRALQGDIHGLALRMLWNREDAENATQEILVRAITFVRQVKARSFLDRDLSITFATRGIELDVKAESSDNAVAF